MKKKFKSFINYIISYCFRDTLTAIFCSQNLQNAKAGVPSVQVSSSNTTQLSGLYSYNDMSSYNSLPNSLSALTSNMLPPLTNCNTSIGSLNLSGISGLNTSGLTANLNSMVLETNNSTRSSLNRPCSYTIKLYHAVGGYVAEILKHNEDDNEPARSYSSGRTGSLHILNNEKLGDQLEKAIAYESLKQ